MTEEKKINIYWEGPFSYEKTLEEFKDKDKDYGVYQLYGTHQVYGFNILLYIGMACDQTFSVRLSQHSHWFDEQALPIATKVRIGRLEGKTPSRQIWSDEIRKAEKLLILAHCPSLNSSGLKVPIYKRHEEFGIHVLNWGKCGLLLPEVSGLRFSSYSKEDDDGSDYLDYYSCIEADKH